MTSFSFIIGYMKQQPSAGTLLRDRQRDSEHASEIKLLAIDMDGTLLDSKGQCLPSSVKAIEVRSHASCLSALKFEGHRSQI